MQQPTSSTYLIVIHRIQLQHDDHGNVDANHGNNNCDGNDGGNRNGNGDGDGDGDGSCDYKANRDAIATDMGIALVVVEVLPCVLYHV